MTGRNAVCDNENTFGCISIFMIPVLISHYMDIYGLHGQGPIRVCDKYHLLLSNLLNKFISEMDNLS